MKITIDKIGPDKTKGLKEFLKKSPKSTQTFRYFSSRPLSVLKDHLLTILAYKGTSPCGYGHLDQEEGIVWLGICVRDSFTGQGIGRNLMNELVRFADFRSLPIQLSVDSGNLTAINLYKKFKFRTERKENNITFMRRN